MTLCRLCYFIRSSNANLHVWTANLSILPYHYLTIPSIVFSLWYPSLSYLPLSSSLVLSVPVYPFLPLSRRPSAIFLLRPSPRFSSPYYILPPSPSFLSFLCAFFHLACMPTLTSFSRCLSHRHLSSNPSSFRSSHFLFPLHSFLLAFNCYIGNVSFTVLLRGCKHTAIPISANTSFLTTTMMIRRTTMTMMMMMMRTTLRKMTTMITIMTTTTRTCIKDNTFTCWYHIQNENLSVMHFSTWTAQVHPLRLHEVWMHACCTQDIHLSNYCRLFYCDRWLL